MAVNPQAASTGARVDVTSLVAGAAAGAVAAVASVGVQLAMGVRYPEAPETAWSAFVAGIAGGLLYSVLVRLVRHPARALWAASLGIATLDSLLVILLPLPAGHGPHLAIPIEGLVVPVRQMAALVGLGHLGARYFPAALLPADAVLHYIPAAIVATLVPWLAGTRRE